MWQPTPAVAVKCPPKQKTPHNQPSQAAPGPAAGPAAISPAVLIASSPLTKQSAELRSALSNRSCCLPTFAVALIRDPTAV